MTRSRERREASPLLHTTARLEEVVLPDTSEQHKKIKARIRRYERSLRKEQAEYGFIDDGYGKRYLLGPLYLQIEDLLGALQSFRWFEQTFPDVRKIVDPLQQMKVKINELKTSAVPIVGTGSNKRVLALLKEISQRVPKSLDVQVSRMVVDLEAVRMSGKTDTFNTVDNLKNSLEASTYFSAATISSANLDRTGNQVQFEIKLQRVR